MQEPNLTRRGWLTSCASGTAAAASVLLPRGAHSADGAELLDDPRSTSPEVTLFSFDNVSIPFSHNLRLSMWPPEKHAANPVVRRGGPGTPDEMGVQFYGSVVRVDGRFRMWYVAVDRELERDGGCVRCWRPAYAESEDGVHWIKPELGLVEYHGSRHNNLVLMDPAPLGVVCLKVLVEPDDPDPARRHKMSAHTWWTDGKARGRATLAPLFSPDGLRWRLAISGKPVKGMLPVEDIVLPRHHFEAAGGLHKWNGMYYASGQGGPEVRNGVVTFSRGDGHGVVDCSGRELLMHRSPDFIHWSRTAHVGFLREGQHRSFPRGQGEEAHEGVSVWNRGNVLLGLYGLWHGARQDKDVSLDLGFLVSNDGAHFREPIPEWTFLRRGEDGAWDQGGLLQGQGFENVGEQTLIWYGAWDPRESSTAYQPRGGVGLATLPRDRFGSLSPRYSEREAELITAPVQLTDTATILANVAGLGTHATLRVELLDQREQPLPRYAGDNAAVVRESGFACPVLWKGGGHFAELREPVRMRVIFDGQHRQQIALYALYVHR